MKNSTNIHKKKGLSKIIIGFMIIIGIGGLFSGCSDSTAQTNSTNNSNNAVTTTNTKPSTSNEASNNTINSTNDNKPSDSGQSTSTTSKDSNTNNQQSQSQVQSTPAPESKPVTTPQPPATPSVSSEDSTIVYYVSGSKVYHLSKSDGTLSRSKNIQSMTLKEAQAQGMHQSKSKADQ
jgi:cytoskeletal protein RodZ